MGAKIFAFSKGTEIPTRSFATDSSSAVSSVSTAIGPSSIKSCIDELRLKFTLSPNC